MNITTPRASTVAAITLMVRQALRQRISPSSAHPEASHAHGVPGTMQLRAVREAGCIVDFSWDFADATAARLLARHGLDALRGMRLTEVIAGPPDILHLSTTTATSSNILAAHSLSRRCMHTTAARTS